MREPKRVAGFSLIEVLIALAVLMIGLEAVLALQIAAIRQLRQARSRTAATQIASQIMEKLKTCPLDPGSKLVPPNPAVIFSDSAGKTYRDNPEDNKALLYDKAVGDGYVTWHRLRPIRMDGTIMGDSVTASNYDPNYGFIAAYSVEWGPILLGNVEPNRNPGSANALVKAGYPSQLPGYQEVYLEVWVGWVEAGEQYPTAGGVLMKSAWDYYTHMNSTFTGTPSQLSIFTRHYVTMISIRRNQIGIGGNL